MSLFENTNSPMTKTYTYILIYPLSCPILVQPTDYFVPCFNTLKSVENSRYLYLWFDLALSMYTCVCVCVCVRVRVRVRMCMWALVSMCAGHNPGHIR